jgi:hypothetical protein
MLKIRKGREYKFLVEKELTLPDGTNYFLLKGPDTRKYLISVRHYSHYGIVSGNVIKCRIDKVNCKGEIFLEPESPFYRPGSVSKMKVTGFTRSINNSSFTISLKDKHGFTHYIETAELPDGKEVRCKVIMIKKGKPLLELL